MNCQELVNQIKKYEPYNEQEEALMKSMEPWFVENVYTKLIEKTGIFLK